MFILQEHSGGLGGGHYTAHAMNWQDHKWYSFNDSYVQPGREEEAVSPNAYVLFYRRRVPGGWVPPPLPPPAAPPAAGTGRALRSSWNNFGSTSFGDDEDMRE